MLGYTALKLLTGKQRQAWRGLGEGKWGRENKGRLEKLEVGGGRRWERPAGVKAFHAVLLLYYFTCVEWWCFFQGMFLLMGK